MDGLLLRVVYGGSTFLGVSLLPPFGGGALRGTLYRGSLWSFLADPLASPLGLGNGAIGPSRGVSLWGSLSAKKLVI